MFKVSAFLADTATDASPLDDCYVNDRLIKAAPFINQSFFQMVDVTDLTTVHSRLQNTPDCVVNRINPLTPTVTIWVQL